MDIVQYDKSKTKQICATSTEFSIMDHHGLHKQTSVFGDAKSVQRRHAVYYKHTSVFAIAYKKHAQVPCSIYYKQRHRIKLFLRQNALLSLLDGDVQ